MRYLSVCSGIEAATCAWHHMGWEPVAFSEIEKFPSAVLKHHYPSVPNWGDMTKFEEWPDACVCRKLPCNHNGNSGPGNDNERICAKSERGWNVFGELANQGKCHECGGTNVDVLVGGTPCQSFSVAGLRKGLDDPRGNLMLTYLAIAKRYRPQWLVWENVPGVLSSNGGRDFAALLRGLDELGYGWAYRVLDAQYFGVAQRRRRVFVVGHLGNWQRAAAVLFERHSLSGHPAPSRQARKGAAGSVAGGAATGGWPADVSPTLNAHFGSKQGLEDQHVNGGGGCLSPPVAMCLITKTRLDSETETLIPTIGGGFDVPLAFKVRGGCEGGGKGYLGSDDAAFTVATTQDQWLAQPVAFHHNAQACQLPSADRDTSVSDALTCSQQAAVAQPVAYSVREDAIANTFSATELDVSNAVTALQPSPQSHHAQTFVAQPIGLDEEQNARIDGFGTLKARMEGGGFEGSVMTTTMQVRRLTAEECEKLQGFLPGYTNIPWRGKPESPDGPRYKALGNSMAVPVMRWIGERINQVEAI